MDSRLDDSYVTSTYDDFGRVLSETDALGNTKNFEYDDQGRLTAVILPEVLHSDTQQMVRPRYEYEYDAQGNRTVIRDNVVQIGSTVYYDHDGVAGDDVRETRSPTTISATSCRASCRWAKRSISNTTPTHCG